MNYSHFFSESQSVTYIKQVTQYTTPHTKIMIGAYDFCITMPDSDIECFDNFENLYNHIKTL